MGLGDVLEKESHESAGFKFWRARFPTIEHTPAPPILPLYEFPDLGDGNGKGLFKVVDVHAGKSWYLNGGY